MFSKKIRLISLFFLLCNILLAQPIITRPVVIKNTFYEEKRMYYKSWGFIADNTLCLYDEKLYENITIGTQKNKKEFLNLVYRKDTMKLNLLYQQWLPVDIEIERFNFSKGVFIIDLHAYVDSVLRKQGDKASWPVVIGNFPEDCLNFEIAEDD